MIEIGGMPLLVHIMKIYSHFGFNDFVVCLGYMGYFIKEYFSNFALHNTDVTYDFGKGTIEYFNNVAEPWRVSLVDTGLHTMTGGRLRRVRNLIGNETFMLTYGDGVSDVDIAELIRFHRRHGRAASVTAVQPPGRFRSALAGKVFGVIFLVVDTLRQLSRPGRAVSLVILSALVWVLEGGVFISATHAAGVPLDLAGAFFALSTATLSTLLPSSPGYLGTFHFFAMQAAIAFGAAPASAAAFAILVHLMLWAPTTVAGFIVFAAGSLRSGRNQSAVESTLPASGAAR